ncbi:hypothetical protein Tco_0441296 [Tanacetum coccineum]
MTAYNRGLTDNIKGEVTSFKPVSLSEAVGMAHRLMDQKSQARDERILEGKKQKWENFQSGNSSGKGNQRDNSRKTLHNNQRQGNAQAMVTAPYDGKASLVLNDEKNVATGANALSIPTCYDCAGPDMSFHEYRFSSMLDINPVKIGASYEVELADGRVVSTNTVLKGCTLNLVNHVFEIDLMPIELGTFNGIIGMDWLIKHEFP